MQVRRFITIAATGMVIAAGAAGCKRSPLPAAQTVDNVPVVQPASTQQIEKEKMAKVLADFYNLPPLGVGVVFKTPDGEVWDRYPNGILTRDLKPSNKEVPKLGQTVSIVYTGTFPGSNKVFDKNSASNPLVFRLGSKSIIQGLSMGLSTMHVGGRRRILIPSELAYGISGQAGKIEPNQALIFDVELLAVSGESLEFPKDEIPVDQPLGPALPDAPAAATQPESKK